jgi:hypothetical protein
MKVLLLLLVAIPLLALPTMQACADTTYLEATFDDKPVDQPIGTGGPSVGEPIGVTEGYITAMVRQGPTPSRCIEIQDANDYGAGAVTFEFLGSQEITSGFLSIAFDLWFHQIGEGHSFFVSVREQGSSAKSFANVDFVSDGNVVLTDAAHGGSVIGTYVTGKVFPVVLNYNMEAGTYDVWLDGLQVVFNQSHGVTDRGIGRVHVGCTHDPDLDGVLSLDRVRVTDYHLEVAAEPASWGTIRSLFRN